MEKITFTKSLQDGINTFLQKSKKSILFMLVFASMMLTGINRAEAQGCSMACTNINVNIGNNCIARVQPNMVLQGTSGQCGNPDNYILTIRATMNGPILYTGTNANPALVNGFTYLNQVLIGEVTDPATGAKCWGFVRIEDKTPPQINCSEQIIECDEMLSYTPEVSDNCLVVSVILINEVRRNGNCNPDSREGILGITTVVTRTYVAIDHVGLRDTCTVDLLVRRPDLENVDMPNPNVELGCSDNFALDQNGNPHPSVTGYPTYNGVNLDPAHASLYCNLFVGYTDINLPGLCLGERKIMRRWTVSEWYCGKDFDLDGVQIILLKDNVAPVIDCGPTLEVSTGFYSCASTIFIPRPAVSDNCSPGSAIIVDLMFGNTFIHNFQGGNISGFQVGSNVITFRAYDNCGNSSSCTRTVIVTDAVPPIAICRTFTTASLGIDGTAQVPWSSFDDGSYDNCGIEKIEVRRMNSHECDLVPVFRSYVPVCCEDVGTPVIVILRVTDTSGNTNECMVELEVQDKLPAFILGPPDITVQCGFDLSDLSVFGRIANYTKGEVRNPIIINGVNWGLDGYAFDNCQVMIFMNESINLTSCGAGTVTRVFNAVGAGNNTVATWTQTITVENNVSYLPQSIKWPCDLTVFDLCVNDPATELAPSVLAVYNGTGASCYQGIPAFYDRPLYADDECTQVGVSYKDHVFEIQDSACYKILREWKLIDWCAMEQNPGLPIEYYIYSDIQVIKIMNTVGPEITCPASVTVCSYQEVCSTGEVLTLTASATDDCTREEDLFWRWEYFQNNGIQVTASGNSKTMTRSFPVGTHRVRFLVEDKCGNTDACTTIVTIEDCKQPTPICHHLTTDLMVTGMVRINAKVFNAGSYDNCTQPQNLQYRIEVQPFATPAPSVPPLGADTAYVFTCDDLGLNVVRIWVGDEDGNWDFCETTIIVQNNAGADCEDDLGGIIAGMIITEGHETVEKVDVRMEGQQSGNYMTGNEGMFEFTNIARGTSFAIRPSRVDEARNGLSTTDLLLIQRHILGLEDLNSPYKLLAADVNQSGAITGADLVEIRKVILNNSSEFSNGPSWKFVKKDYRFYDEQNPWSENYPQEMMVLNFNGNVPMVEFVGVKMGDVNNSVRANSNLQGMSGRNSNALVFDVEDVRMKSGNEYRVSFRSGAFRSIYGYQFTMNFNTSAMSLVGIEAGVLDVTEDNFGLRRVGEGYLTTSWHAVEGMSAGSDDELFTLVFRAHGEALLSEVLNVSSEITHAEAYEELHTQPLDVRLVFQGSRMEVSGTEFELFQNRPNPFNAETVISFNLPETGNASVTVYDVTGKVVKMVAGEFVKGYNEVRIQASELGTAAGVLYYELKTDQATATKKMIMIN